MYKIFLLVVLGISATSFASQRSVDKILDAICQVESGGKDINGDWSNKEGKFLAIGPLQIWQSYHYDATHNSKGEKIHPGTYQDCRRHEYAKQVVIWYWERYCPKALKELDYETLSRVQNGGPKGHLKQSTVKYWNKVQQKLK